MILWVALGKVLPAGQERCSFHSIQHWEAAPRVLPPVPGPSVKKRHGHPRGCTTERHQGDEETGAPLLLGETERAGTDHPGEKEMWGEVPSNLNQSAIQISYFNTAEETTA